MNFCTISFSNKVTVNRVSLAFMQMSDMFAMSEAILL